MTLRFLTAGESHGPALTAIIWTVSRPGLNWISKPSMQIFPAARVVQAPVRA